MSDAGQQELESAHREYSRSTDRHLGSDAGRQELEGVQRITVIATIGVRGNSREGAEKRNAPQWFRMKNEGQWKHPEACKGLL
jgi:hypothetical protein